MKFERGGFALGLVVGLLVGLALALAVALYITKAPVPFVNKVPLRTPEQDAAEAERNKNWDPNAPLAPKVARPPLPSASGAASAAATPPAPPAPDSAAKPARDPAAILSGAPLSTPTGPEAFTYLVQVGAFTRAEDAEAQRAKLAMQGFSAKVFEREQAGRVVYRVRIGPVDTKAEADALQSKLQSAGIEGQLVRVQKP
jgi:cell division protein FtsN